MFNWGYIGSGGIAHTTAKAIKDLKDHKIYAVWSRTLEHAKSFSKEFNTKLYENLDDLLKDKNINCVYIATNNHTHFDLVKKCILAHKPVLCEKPITLNAKELTKLIALSKKEKVYFSEAMWTWYNPISLKVRDIVKNNCIGKIKSAEGTFNQILLGKERFVKRLADINQGGGALLDLGVYPIRYAYELFGYPKKIICKGVKKYDVDITEHITFVYKDFKVNLMSSSVDKYKDYFEITGDKGSIKINDFHCSYDVEVVTGNIKHNINVINRINPYVYQFDEVKKDILSKKLESSFVSLKSSLDVMKIMDECRTQMKLVFPQEK